MPWLCHQLGSREHYSIPRALHQQGQLGLLQTDSWLRPSQQWLPRMLGQRALAARYHPELASAPVKAFTCRRLVYDLGAKLRRRGEWDCITGRDHWFQRSCLSALERALDKQPQSVVFSYSYTAWQLFARAKSHGAPCVLGQIDPGPAEYAWLGEQLPEPASAALVDRPSDYWDHWREEVELADRILVNSEWSKQLLVERSGLPAEKIDLVPLAYRPKQPIPAPKTYPEKFTSSRPLRLLFLGQVIHRKGVHLLLEAMQALQDAPLQLDLAGPVGMELSRRCSQITVHGPVDRDKAESLYAKADLFILPTLSDGFALTQLEAAAHRLPLICSRYCGRVVENETNGLLLQEVSVDSIKEAILRCIENPDLLAEWSSHQLDWSEYSLEKLGERLIKLR